MGNTSSDHTSPFHTIEGSLDAANKKFAIIASRWHQSITEKLINGALTTLQRYGAALDNITVIRVPGSFEISCAAQAVAESGTADAIITLGLLVKGDTDHYELIAREVAQGCTFVSTQFRIPVSFGVLTVHDMTHAEERAGGKHGNKGDEAALAAIEMVSLLEKLAAPTEGAHEAGGCCGHCHS